jgi:hypothetical protein
MMPPPRRWRLSRKEMKKVRARAGRAGQGGGGPRLRARPGGHVGGGVPVPGGACGMARCTAAVPALGHPAVSDRQTWDTLFARADPGSIGASW